ncbi:hypothetical protein GCM10007984_11180 [Shewanella putrefaciens]|nr:hypothetical protein GCM10007984_11180 [Shewanella putrefaciens]
MSNMTLPILVLFMRANLASQSFMGTPTMAVKDLKRPYHLMPNIMQFKPLPIPKKLT